MEGDATFSPRGLTSGDFNPRPPWGGRLRNRTQETPSVGISIHALRGEGDCIADFYFSTALYFNPRPPWGGRLPITYSTIGRPSNFNPRPPWGGRRARAQTLCSGARISIHALRGEGDESKRKHNYFVSEFHYPPAVGTSPSRGPKDLDARAISIHALRGEGDATAKAN